MEIEAGAESTSTKVDVAVEEESDVKECVSTEEKKSEAGL
jgi:hypothetical protein